MEQPKKRWNYGVTLGELLGAFILIFGAFLMFWKTTDVRLSALEIQMQQKSQNDNSISIKLDKLQEGINDVKLSLKDKQDRKP